MNTKQTYYFDAYSQKLSAHVLLVEANGAKTMIEVSDTVFYPEGGGQPSDQGRIIGPNGELKVEFVRFKDGRILHQGTLRGHLQPGETVQLELKWSLRHRNMRVHAAGHLVHDFLTSIIPDLTPIKGNHSANAFLQYAGEIDPTLKPELERKINEVLATNLPIQTRESTYDELAAKCKFLPATLPKNKPLRIIQIGNYPPMPDGGVHVKSTAEIGSIVIQDIVPQADNTTIVKYRISGGANN
jgi:Ser-tRNA(Ala) deacylase AlaX